MKLTKLENMDIREFYNLYRGKLYTSNKYPKCLFKIDRIDIRNKIICTVVKGEFTKTPVLDVEGLSNRGVYFIETFEEGLNNL